MNNTSTEIIEEIPNPFKQINDKINDGFTEIKNILKGLNFLDLSGNPKMLEEDRILDIREAADYVKLSVPSMYRLCGVNQLPHFKTGKKIRFSKDELTAWIKSGRKESESERLLPPSKIKKS